MLPYKDLVSVVVSAGTRCYDVGSSPDPRTMCTLEAHGIANYVHSARMVGRATAYCGR